MRNNDAKDHKTHVWNQINFHFSVKQKRKREKRVSVQFKGAFITMRNRFILQSMIVRRKKDQKKEIHMDHSSTASRK